VMVTVLLGRLREVARAAGGFVVPAPVDVVLAEHTVVQPDLLYIASGRLGIVRERIEGAPDLVVEVVSPATARRDRGEKLKTYAEAGVREYWLAEPATRQIDFLVNRGARFEVALAVDGVYRSEALPEITLDLAELWREVESLMPR
jgi:Uma2 family endonuclease